MNELENYLDKLLIIRTSDSIFSGELKEIDDDNGAILIREKDGKDLKSVAYIDILHCELANSFSNESCSSENIKTKSCTSTVERVGSIAKEEPIYQHKFIPMPKEQKKFFIKDNYKRFGASREISAVTAAIYSTNYIIDRFLTNHSNKKICIVISRNDWFSEVAFNIARALLRHGYSFEINYPPSPDQNSVNHILYLSNESIRKMKEVNGVFDLAIVAAFNYDSIINNDQFKANHVVSLTVPKEHEKITKTSISALFFGPYEKEFVDFHSELVYVESGLSKKSRIKMGLEYVPSCGYIIYRR